MQAFTQQPAGSYLNQMSQQAILSGGMSATMGTPLAASHQPVQQQYNQFQQQFQQQPIQQPTVQTGMSTAAASAMAAVSGVQASQQQQQQVQVQPAQTMTYSMPSMVSQQQQHSENVAYSSNNIVGGRQQQQQTQISTQQQQQGVPGEENLSALPNAITEWKRIQEEITKDKQKLREKTKHAKTLQDYIIEIMKKHDIDALALRNSGARLTFRRNKRAEGLGPKNLEKFLGEYLNSPDQAQAALKYIQDRRVVKTTEGLQLDKLE